MAGKFDHFAGLSSEELESQLRTLQYFRKEVAETYPEKASDPSDEQMLALGAEEVALVAEISRRRGA